MKTMGLSIVLILSLWVTPLLWADHRTEKPQSSPMTLIPEGEFLRGSIPDTGRQDEYPQTRINLKAFYIDTHEVTNSQYVEFLSQTGHKEPFNVFGEGSLKDEKDKDHLPVVQVTWNDAEDYCFWVGKRLPTEAEWEKAARGTDGRVYPWGNSPPTPDHANFNNQWEDGKGLKAVGSFPKGASPYGVQDMAGNVREWVQDWYGEEYYQQAPTENPKGPDTGLLKVVRGGSWHSFEPDIRTAARGKGGFALKTHGVGFRCARDADPAGAK